MLEIGVVSRTLDMDFRVCYFYTARFSKEVHGSIKDVIEGVHVLEFNCGDVEMYATFRREDLDKINNLGFKFKLRDVVVYTDLINKDFKLDLEPIEICVKNDLSNIL